jgi:hypothetical protein
MRSSGPAAGGGSLRWDDPVTVHGAQPSHKTSMIVAGGKRCFDFIVVSLRPIRAAMIEWAAVRRRSLHASLSVEDFGEAVSEVLDKSAETSTVRKSVRGPGKKTSQRDQVAFRQIKTPRSLQN